ncbi:MAG: hypothetical protein GX493_01445 [Firmicutes bacterium]|nr:hypothetical protein [Bacillota bacterium]
MRRFLLGLIVLVGWVVSVAAGPEGSFRMEDPPGDDFGPGTYLYPKNKVFAPYHGHFDLRSFSVAIVGEEVHYEVTMGLMANPWQAPEGFSHQVIEVYIHRGRQGRNEPPVPGTSVRFAPDYPWDVRLKAAPWEAGELLFLRPDGRMERRFLRVGLAGPRTIRMTVPLSLLGWPSSKWRYYVLVGSYDGFAEDNFRPVMAKPGEWHFGGGRDDGWDPNVIDLLAPPRGRFSQERQLGSFDAARGEYAVLFPVGPGGLPGARLPGGPMILLVLLLIGGWMLWYAPASWRKRAQAFWQKVRSRFRTFLSRRYKDGS